MAADEKAVKPANPAKALSYVPVLIGQLDADGREMLGVVMQAQRDGGYEDGFDDGRRAAHDEQGGDSRG